MPAAEILVGTAAAVLTGRNALPRARRFSASAIAQDFILGLSIVVPLAFAWGLAGLPWSPLSMTGLALGTALVLRRARPDRSVAAPVRSRPRGLDRAAELLLALGALIGVWKWLRTPLWSWDHFAIWGLKARRMVVDGTLDLAFLGLRAHVVSNPPYPIGLPLAWRFLSPSLPSAADFRLAHALFAASLLAATHAAARRLGASRAAAALLAAALCASPLFWDTEAVGLADLPLAAVAVAAFLLALEAREEEFPAWPAGLALGFLSWIKMEGLPLGAFLAAACVAGLAGRKRLAMVAPWALSTAAALATQRWLLPASGGFLQGDWRARLSERARDPLAVLSAMLRELTGPEWLGLWLLFAVAAVASLFLPAPTARRLSAVVLAQLLVFAFIYFATFLDPAKHIWSSFHRIAAALLPLALLVMAGIAGASRKSPLAAWTPSPRPPAQPPSSQ
jgi:hypothetical protein